MSSEQDSANPYRIAHVAVMTISCSRCGEEWPRDPALEVVCPHLQFSKSAFSAARSGLPATKSDSARL